MVPILLHSMLRCCPAEHYQLTSSTAFTARMSCMRSVLMELKPHRTVLPIGEDYDANGSQYRNMPLILPRVGRSRAKANGTKHGSIAMQYVGSAKMKLSVVIPCFNERKTIGEILSRVEACAHHPKEIVVVDDCSTDGTRDILRNRPSRDSERIIFHERNQGKGAA